MYSYNANASKYLMAFMYTGELPEEYYLRAVDVADEDLHMEDFLFRSKLFAALLLGIIVFFGFAGLVIICVYCGIKVEKRKMDEMMRRARLQRTQVLLSKRKTEGSGDKDAVVLRNIILQQIIKSQNKKN
jgi:hypothetical protein